MVQSTLQTLTRCKQTLNVKNSMRENAGGEKELMMNLDIPCGVSICHCQVNRNSDAPVTVGNNISLYPCYLLSSSTYPHYV